MADPAPWQPIPEPPPVTGEDGKMLPWVWQNTVHANGGATRAEDATTTTTGEEAAATTMTEEERLREAERLRRAKMICALCPCTRGPGPAFLPVPHVPNVLRGGVKPPKLGEFTGPYLPDKKTGIASTWAHQSCVVWSPEVWFCAKKGRLRKVNETIKRGNQLKCTHCNLKGANKGCNVEKCNNNYHLVCAHAVGCRFNASTFQMYCPKHATKETTPAPHWADSIEGDVRMRGGDGEHIGEPSGATPLLDRLARGDGGKRKREEYRQKGGKRAAEARHDGVITAVMAAAERLREENEHEMDDEEAFAKRMKVRLAKDKGKIPCVTVGGSCGGGGFDASNDDPDAMPGGWETLAGAEREIQVLKELALLPLTYPEAFARLGVAPGRGVLLHGPPGTGKTAAVRALLGAAARGPRPVSFFSRRGADCLGKYHGDAEREIRLLFEEAERRQPSIIFFDEIDGLAPARTSSSDSIHGSVVATLLALMDGLNPRGSVVVVAATNRPDAVDPALRRPGRFDRELHFSLPGPAARRAILRLHTQHWRPRPTERTIAAVAAKTEGAAGADLRALASAALLSALRRKAPRLLACDPTREKLAAELEPMLPPPPRHAELLAAAKDAASRGHVGASLAVHEFDAVGARVEVFWSGNDLFFPATVTAYDIASMAHRVTYDEGGEHHWLRLWREGEVIRVLKFRGDGGAEEEEEEEKEEKENDAGKGNDAAAAGAGTTRPKPSEPPLPTVMEAAATTDADADADAAAGEAAASRPKLVFVLKKPAAAEDAAARAKDEPSSPPKPPAPAPPLAPVDDVPAPPPSADAPLAVDPRPISVVCRNKQGQFRPLVRMIRCLCASCHNATLEGRHEEFDPRKWEAHCGSVAKKWKSSIKVVIDPGKGFLGGEGYQDIPIGKWLEMQDDGMTPAQAIAAAVETNRMNEAAAKAAAGLIDTPPPDAPVDPFDPKEAAAAAKDLRDAFARASSKRAGLRVTAKDWAVAMQTATGPCALRSAAGGALTTMGAPLPRHLAPALSSSVLTALRALIDAGAPLDSTIADAVRASNGGALDAEAVLLRAGVLDGEVAAAAERGASREEEEEEEEDDERDDERDGGGRDGGNDAEKTAAYEAAAALSGHGPGGPKRHPVRILLCGSGAQGQGASLAALVHVLQGVPSFTVSLASLLAAGGGDPAVGCVQGLKEPLRCAARSPSLLHLSRLEAWALAAADLPADWAGIAGAGAGGDAMEEEWNDGDIAGVMPSHLWDTLEQTLSATGAAAGDGGADGGPGQLIVAATTSLPADALPPRVLRFFQPDCGGGAGASCVVLDLSPPDRAARAACVARGAATIIQGAVAPTLKTAAARRARAALAAEEAEAATAAATEESSEEELRRVRLEKTVAAERAARAAAAKALAATAKDARARVAAALAHVAATLAKTARFAPALREHPPAKAFVVSAAAGELTSPLAFIAALKKSIAGLRPSKLGRRREYEEASAAAAAAIDAAETYCHHLAPLVKAAEDAEAEYFAAKKEAEATPPSLRVEGGEVANETATGPTAPTEPSTPSPPGAAAAAAAPTTDATRTTAETTTPAPAPSTATSAPPSARPSARAKAFLRRAAEEATKCVGPSVEDAAAAAAALTSALVSRVARHAVGADAIDALLGTCAGALTHRARRATAPFSLGDVLDACEDEIQRACDACVATAEVEGELA